MSVVRLPILDDTDDVRGSILADGNRKKIIVADVSGRFHTVRVIVIGVLLVSGLWNDWMDTLRSTVGTSAGVGADL